MIVIRKRRSIYAFLFCHHRNQPLLDLEFHFFRVFEVDKLEMEAEGFAHSAHMMTGDLSGLRVSLITQVRNSRRATCVGRTVVNNKGRCPSDYTQSSAWLQKQV